MAERKQSISMIARRSSQLVGFVKAVRKFRFKEAAGILGVSKPRGVSRHKQFANNFLEFHLGWTPLVKDIGAAVEVLQSTPPSAPVRASSRGTWWDQTGPWPRVGPNLGDYSWRRDGIYRSWCGATIESVNPDLLLANQLGFVNPLSLAWELVPFSFVLDWFVSVGDFLEGMTARLGITIKNVWTTRSATTTYDYRFKSNGLGFGTQKGVCFDLIRETKLYQILPAVKPFQGFSVKRGLTAVSLLIQQLRS
jgi:hypothetical protein